MNVYWAHMHIGHSTGEFLGESWEDCGFRVDANGKPTHDSRRNTVGRYTEEEFDPSNPDHVRLACEYATSDGCSNREELHEYLTSEFGLTPEQVENELGEWIDEQNSMA